MNPARHLPRSLAAQALIVILAAGSAGSAGAAGIVTVTQHNRAFSQRDATARKGDLLRVTNDDEFVHQLYVEASAMTFESAEQFPGATIDIPLPAAGRFEVRCRIHPKMLLSITVR